MGVTEGKNALAYRAGYGTLLAFEMVPKLGNVISHLFVVAFLFTLLLWAQDGTLYEAHPLKSLWLFWSAGFTKIAVFIYEYKMSKGRNQALMQLAPNVMFALVKYAFDHWLKVLDAVIVLAWVTTYTMKHSRHPDFGFFTDISGPMINYGIPAIWGGFYVGCEILRLGLDYANSGSTTTHTTKAR